MHKNARILVTGTTGMVGAALLRILKIEGYGSVLSPARAELDLLDRRAVFDYFALHRPEHVFMVAARVGGIAANQADPVGFLDENLQITLNLFAACHLHPTLKNLFLGSSCIYPRECPQPMREGHLLTGPLEPTNEAYALAKIAGLKAAVYYERQFGVKTVCPMPCNVYGTGDHFDFERSHVLSALVRRFVDAADERADRVTLWGTGIARREFVHVEDVARACLFFMRNVETSEHVNVGPGVDISIRDLASLIGRMAGYAGTIEWDPSRPDGMLRKCLEVSRLRALGFDTAIGLEEGIARTLDEYRALKAHQRKAA